MDPQDPGLAPDEYTLEDLERKDDRGEALTEHERAAPEDGQELNLYRLRRAGQSIPPAAVEYLARLTSNELGQLEAMAVEHDAIEAFALDPGNHDVAPCDPSDPRLAAVLDDRGRIDRSVVARLLAQDPRTFTMPEILAMHVIVFENQRLAAGLSYTQEWLEAFTKVIGGTVVRERRRHGQVVTRSVRRYRGSDDVRRYRRAELQPRHRHARARERRPGHRRVRSSTRAGPSDDDGPGEPPALALAPAPRAIYSYACLTPEQRGAA